MAVATLRPRQLAPLGLVLALHPRLRRLLQVLLHRCQGCRRRRRCGKCCWYPLSQQLAATPPLHHRPLLPLQQMQSSTGGAPRCGLPRHRQARLLWSTAPAQAALQRRGGRTIGCR